MFGIILTIIQIFFMLPKIFETIKTIIDMIKLLRGEEKKAAQAELKAILKKYKDVNRKDKQQVAERGAVLQRELDELKAKLEKKIQ